MISLDCRLKKQKFMDNIIEPNYTDSFSFQDICENLKAGENFTFSRIASDGELNAIMGKAGSNCDAHPYDKTMGKHLKAILEIPKPYTIGLQRMAYTVGNNKNQPYIDWITNQYGHKWAKADIIHHASINGVFERDFIPALRNRKVILVAPSRLSKLMTKYPDSFGTMTHIVIPDVYCYQAFDDVLRVLKSEVSQDDVVIYCASMMTKILIDRIYNIWTDTITQIDAGSVFEPYVGYNNRSYHKKIKSRI